MPTRAATAKAPRALTQSKRKSLATEQLLSGLSATDKEAAITAALEIVNEWLSASTEAHQRLHERYIELESLAVTKGTTKKAPPRPQPQPISGPDLDHFNPYELPDPYKLLEWYGRDQLRDVIGGASPQTLRVFVNAVQEREPGTKPASRSKKQDMIDYVVQHVAGRDI